MRRTVEVLVMDWRAGRGSGVAYPPSVVVTCRGSFTRLAAPLTTCYTVKASPRALLTRCCIRILQAVLLVWRLIALMNVWCSTTSFLADSEAFRVFKNSQRYAGTIKQIRRMCSARESC